MTSKSSVRMYDLWYINTLVDSWKDDLALQEVRNNRKSGKRKNHSKKGKTFCRKSAKMRNYQKFKLSEISVSRNYYDISI